MNNNNYYVGVPLLVMADNPFSLLFEPLEHGERESDNTSSNPALESLVKSLSPLLDDVDIERKEIDLSDGERTIDKSIHYDDNGKCIILL